MRRVTRQRRRNEPFTERHRRYLAKSHHVAQFRPPGAIAARLVGKHPPAIEAELRDAWRVLGPSIMAQDSGMQSWGYLHFGAPQ